MFYTAYGLTIQSQLDLPELERSFPSVAPDVTVRLGTVGAGGLPGGRQLGPYLWVGQNTFWLQVPGVARFLVQSGTSIWCDPEVGVDEDSVRVFLLGSSFGALLLQRGHLVLHGNAIRIGDACMLCVGPSGAGKSTLAAGFLQRGYEILADDIVPVDAQCRALPGFPRIKLWRDMADQLNIDTGDLRRIRPNTEKFNYPLPPASPHPLPIRWVYILGSDQNDTLRLEPIQGMHRFQPLHGNIYRVRFLHGTALKAEHLQLCGQLAGKIRLARVTRPRTGFSLVQMINRILADIAEHP
ncbi:hypothetical protein ACLIIZ_05905 [Azonexus caeni]|uniref:hypothetical protein n=1 Tax=Azonexus caeni TaxID=266126 RepID=UPI003A8B61C8